MTRRRRLLMFAFYFPPLGMGGVQRPLKFAKYLPEFGWNVTVITAEPGGYVEYDPTLLDDVPDGVDIIRVKSLDPSSFANNRVRETGGTPSSSKLSHLIEQAREWARWPDAKIHFARVAAREALRRSDALRFDAVYTTSPPPSIHSAGLRVRRALSIPWVADFRDPWMVAVDDWGPTAIHRRYAENLRARILRQADQVLVMNDMVADVFQTAAAQQRLSIIPNGYDEDDFTGVTQQQRGDDFIVAFYGTDSPHTDIRPVLDLITEFNAHNPQRSVRLVHVGTTLGAAVHTHPAYTTTGYLPHRDAIAQLCNADAAVITLSPDPSLRMTIPGRTYEVLRSLRPILCMAPAGSLLAQILEPFHGVWTCDFGDTGCALSALDQITRLDRRTAARDVASIQCFDRRTQTFQLSGILDELVTLPQPDRGGE
ncbi:MAG: glycosyltransferase [Candidatus Zixiibacteriota bacterium]